MISLKDAKGRFRASLSARYNESEIGHLWRIFYMHVTGKPGLSYYSEGNLTNDQDNKLFSALKRLSVGEPYQYVLGQVPFGPLDLIVKPGVLIPRPETEELIEIIYRGESSDSVEAILDIGTGSGCIALSLAYYYPKAIVSSLDISDTALAIAQENAYRNSLDIKLIKHDILRDDPCLLPQVNLLVSNPPYITRTEAEQMTDTVLDYEPAEALFVEDEDPLLFYRRIEEVAQKILSPEGRIYLELNEKYAKDCENIYSAKGWQVSLIEDMSSNLRFLKAWK